MIRLVTGPPGAGKTFYAMREFEVAVLDGRYVATNVKLVDDWAERIARSIPRLKFRPSARARWIDRARRRVLYVETLGELAQVRLSTKGFEKNPEGRGLAIFDEAGEALDARAWNEDKARRRADNRFMRQHRKLGWDVVLIAQEEEQIDARTRGMAEYVVRLKNLKRARVLGVRLSPVNLFIAIWAWHGMQGGRPAKREWFRLSRRQAGLYDTHQLVDSPDDDPAQVVWLPLQSGTVDGARAERSAGAASPEPPNRPVALPAAPPSPAAVPSAPDFPRSGASW